MSERAMVEEREFIRCPHEVVAVTCAGVCNCPCDACAPSRPVRPDPAPAPAPAPAPTAPPQEQA